MASKIKIGYPLQPIDEFSLVPTERNNTISWQQATEIRMKLQGISPATDYERKFIEEMKMRLLYARIELKNVELTEAQVDWLQILIDKGE